MLQFRGNAQGAARGGLHQAGTCISPSAGPARLARDACQSKPRCLCVFTQQGSVGVQQLDLSDLASVRVAAAALGELGDINMLILNAGVMVSCPDVICDSRMSLFRIFSWAAETPTQEMSAPFQPRN